MSQGRRYRLIGALGKGGFGTVYRADLLGESGFTRQVALKVLNPDMENVATVASRLRDEARLLGMLRHRAIVDVDGLVRLDGRWTVVMEYVAGADLGRLMGLGPLPQGPALEIIGEVAGALHVAYTTPGPSGEPLRLLHRDIKPQNVIVTPNGEVKVLDFGVARADFAGREAQTRAMLLGSLSYMAPERFEHNDGPGSDVYAMGVVLWEMLTGQHFGRVSVKPDKFAMRRDEALQALDGRVLPEVVAFVGDLVSYRAEARPSAREVERLCRDLRLEVRGPWLRDWAEDVVPPLIPADADLEAHDFSSDIVTESQSSATSGALDGGWPDRTPASGPPSAPLSRAAPTLAPDDEALDAPSTRPATWDGVEVPPAPDSTHAGSLPTYPPQDDDEPEEMPPLPAQPALSPASLPATPSAAPPPSLPAPAPRDTAAAPPRGGGGLGVVMQVIGLLGFPVVLMSVGLVIMFSAICCGVVAGSG